MTFDITTKRVGETGTIWLKEADGSPLLDDEANPLGITVFSPGSKQWQAANAEVNRKRAERIRKSGGKIEAGINNVRDDQIEYLTAITIEFVGWAYPLPDKATSQRDMFHAAYSDDLLGYIRDQMWTDTQDWASFTKGLARN